MAASIAPEKLLRSRGRDFYLWDAMGGAVMIGLGIAESYQIRASDLKADAVHCNCLARIAPSGDKRKAVPTATTID